MIENVGDLIATPFFAWLVLYFYRIEGKTTQEYVLYFFSIGGLLADFIFTFLFLKKHGGTKMITATIAYYALAVLFLYGHP